MTVEFSEKNNYGYGKENIEFFTQSMLPMINEDGKLILSKKIPLKKELMVTAGFWIIKEVRLFR